MANINTKQVYSQIKKAGPDLKSVQKPQDKLAIEEGLFTENTSLKADNPTSVPSRKEIPNTQEELNNVENEANNNTGSEKTSIATENTTRKSNITNFFNSALNVILKTISLIRAKAIELNLTFTYSTKKIIALSISLLTFTAICIIGIALVSEIFIPAMLAFWLVSYVFWPVTPAPEEMELKLSTIIESDEADIEDNSDELRALHNLTIPELKIKDQPETIIKEFEATLEKEQPNTLKETQEEEVPENPEHFEKLTFPEQKEEPINKVEREPVAAPQTEVVDYKELQKKVEEVDDIKALNSILAQYINQAIKEIAIKKIQAIFQKKGVKVDTLKSKKMLLREVKSHTDAYQYIMYRMETIEKASTDKSKILEYGDLGQIATNFTFNGKSENYELGLVAIAREAAANVLYVFDKTDLLDKIKERFDNSKTKLAYTKALKNFRIGVTRRSLPIRNKALTTSFTDLYGVAHTVKMSTVSDTRAKDNVIARINTMLGVVEKTIITKI